MMTISKFKKLYLISIWTITFLVMVACSIRFVTKKTGFLSSANMISNHDNFGAEAITELIIDSDCADIDIAYGDALNVECNFPENDQPVIALNDSVLSIVQRDKPEFFNTKNLSARGSLSITIPRGTELDDVDIYSDIGNLTMADLISSNLSLETDMGDVKLERCSIRTGEIDSDMGNLDLDVDFEDLSITSDMGDINITTSSDLNTAKLDIDNDMGSCKVNGQKWH